MAPHPANMRLVEEIVLVPCGNRYQEGPMRADAPVCACGMYAVGQCADCSAPTCGTCGRRIEGRFLCPDHATAREQERREANAAAEIAEAAELAAAEAPVRREAESLVAERRDDVVRRLRSITDASARLVMTLGHFLTVRQEGSRPACVDTVDGLVVSAVFPELWPEPPQAESFGDKPPMRWDSDALAKWLAPRLNATGRPTREFKYGPFGAWSGKTGWEFNGLGPLATRRVDHDRGLVEATNRSPVWVTRGAELWCLGSDNRPTGGGEFHATAFRQMLIRLNLLDEALTVSTVGRRCPI